MKIIIGRKEDIDQHYNRGNHPFKLFDKKEFDFVNSVIEKHKNDSKYIQSLMQCKNEITIDISDNMNSNLMAFYSEDIILLNKKYLNSPSKELFKCIIHEYIHHLQYTNIKKTNNKVWNKKITNNIQDFYFNMFTEADAFTKESSVFYENLTSETIKKVFFDKLKGLVSKINNFSDYHSKFHYLSMGDKSLIPDIEFNKFIDNILSSGSEINGCNIPKYNFTDTDIIQIKEIIDRSIKENMMFEMLAKVNHWNENYTKLVLLENPDCFEDNDYSKWKEKLNTLCIINNHKHKMAELLKKIYKDNTL